MTGLYCSSLNDGCYQVGLVFIGFYPVSMDLIGCNRILWVFTRFEQGHFSLGSLVQTLIKSNRLPMGLTVSECYGTEYSGCCSQSIGSGRQYQVGLASVFFGFPFYRVFFLLLLLLLLSWVPSFRHGRTG